MTYIAERVAEEKMFICSAAVDRLSLIANREISRCAESLHIESS